MAIDSPDRHSREMCGRTQVNCGPCRVCGSPVWCYVDDPGNGPITTAGPIHKRPCLDREAQRDA